MAGYKNFEPLENLVISADANIIIQKGCGYFWTNNYWLVSSEEELTWARNRADLDLWYVYHDSRSSQMWASRTPFAVYEDGEYVVSVDCPTSGHNTSKHMVGILKGSPLVTECATWHIVKKNPLRLVSA